MRRIARLLLPLAVLATLFTSPLPAASVTKGEVDAACSSSNEAWSRVQEATATVEQANEEYARINGELADTAHREFILRDRIDGHERSISDLRAVVQDRAVELYMTGGFQNPDLLIGVGSVESLIAGQEFLEITAKDDVEAVERLTSLSAEAEVNRVELEGLVNELEVLEAAAQEHAVEMQAALNVRQEFYGQLSAECQRLEAAYHAQIQRERAAAAARAAGAAGGVPSEVTPGFICPFNSGESFINDWGFPRSGGRTHKGTDIFNSWNAPMVAVADGTITVRTGGLGGNALYVNADYGTRYYYAHLSSFANGISNGVRVSKGQVIGYNGDSGNATGGAPHLHFGIIPPGGSWVNPFPTLAANC